MPSHRILYVGYDLRLLNFLQETLKDCDVVRSPCGSTPRTLIESRINYSLLLFDDQLLDTTGAELERFARSIKHRERTPVLIYKMPGDFAALVESIARALLDCQRAGY